MNDHLPEFEKPPVVETATSAQFRPIRSMLSVHLAEFWGRHRDDYPRVSDHPPISEQIELFGEDIRKASVPRPPRPQVVTNPTVRLQARQPNKSRMVQVQNGRIVYNWMRSEGDGYPRWSKTKPKFIEILDDFEAFVSERLDDTVEYRQWEVTYVNHLPKGREWSSVSEWPSLLPGIVPDASAVSVGQLEQARFNQGFLLPDDRGRLHVELRPAWLQESWEEILEWKFIARGPAEDRDELDQGLELGHAAIVKTFTELSSESAHSIWERRR